jgi:hypothetical protein
MEQIAKKLEELTNKKTVKHAVKIKYNNKFVKLSKGRDTWKRIQDAKQDLFSEFANEEMAYVYGYNSMDDLQANQKEFYRKIWNVKLNEMNDRISEFRKILVDMVEFEKTEIE